MGASIGAITISSGRFVYPSAALCVLLPLGSFSFRTYDAKSHCQFDKVQFR